jgi:hypothetical protein
VATMAGILPECRETCQPNVRRLLIEKYFSLLHRI